MSINLFDENDDKIEPINLSGTTNQMSAINPMTTKPESKNIIISFINNYLHYIIPLIVVILLIIFLYMYYTRDKNSKINKPEKYIEPDELNKDINENKSEEILENNLDIPENIIENKSENKSETPETPENKLVIDKSENILGRPEVIIDE